MGLTDEGRAIANAPNVALDYHAFMAKLSGKLTQMRLFSAAAAAHPDVLTREQLAEATGMSAASSTFEKYVSQIRSLGLIVYPDKGHVRADDRLFPRAARRVSC